MSLCVRGSTADQRGLAGKRKMKCKECPVYLVQHFLLVEADYFLEGAKLR